MKRLFPELCASFALSALILSAVPITTQAQQVVLIDLEASADGGIPARIPAKIKLSETKPDSITKEPRYRVKSKYGFITMGNAKDNKIAVALDAGIELSEPRLYVDSDGDGDLSNDKHFEMNLQKEISNGGRFDKTYGAYAIVSAKYNREGETRNIASTLSFFVKNEELFYNRVYARTGFITIGEAKYKAALIDQRLDGIFSVFKHGESEEPILNLLIDKNRDGVFNPARETFDCAKPFKIGGKVYEVSSINYNGTRIVLKQSKQVLKGGSLETLVLGGEMIEFDAGTIHGKRASFPDNYEGKLVLLDFWATWCPPCREEIPGTVAVYNQYHPAGLEILGISLDREDKGQVLNFLEQNGMPWTQVYDGKYWKAEIAKLYGVDSIPMSYLVDGSTGTILAKGDSLRGEGLEVEVKKALAKMKKK